MIFKNASLLRNEGSFNKIYKKYYHMQSYKDGTVRETFVLLQYTNTCLLMRGGWGLQKERLTPAIRRKMKPNKEIHGKTLEGHPVPLFVSIFLIIPPHPHPLILSRMMGDVEEKDDQL